MSKSNRKGSENRQNHRSFAAQAAHRASAGPMQDKREKRLGTRAERRSAAVGDWASPSSRRERTERRVSADRDWD